MCRSSCPFPRTCVAAVTLSVFAAALFFFDTYLDFDSIKQLLGPPASLPVIAERRNSSQTSIPSPAYQLDEVEPNQTHHMSGGNIQAIRASEATSTTQASHLEASTLSSITGPSYQASSDSKATGADVSCDFSFLVLPKVRARDVLRPSTAEDEVLMKEVAEITVPLSELQQKAGTSGRVSTCALVSSGGSLVGSKSGSEIDKHDLVFRTNMGGAVLPFVRSEDVGKRTNVLFLNWPDLVQFCYDKEDARLCVPHVLNPHSKTPEEPFQFTVGYLHYTNQIRMARDAKRKLGADAWRLQFFNPASLRKLPRDLHFSHASGGMMTFLVAASYCQRIDLYGYGAKNSGRDYHAYEWCDIDKVLETKNRTKDCTFFEEGPERGGKKPKGGKWRTAYGFNKPMLDHAFGQEAKVMKKFGRLTCLSKCFKKCDRRRLIEKRCRPVRVRN